MKSPVICSQTEICPIYKNWISFIKEEKGTAKIRERLDIIKYNNNKEAYECEAFEGIFNISAMRNGIPQERITDVEAKCSLITMINDINEIKCRLGNEVYSK